MASIHALSDNIFGESIELNRATTDAPIEHSPNIIGQYSVISDRLQN